MDDEVLVDESHSTETVEQRADFDAPGALPTSGSIVTFCNFDTSNAACMQYAVCSLPPVSGQYHWYVGDRRQHSELPTLA